MLSVNNFSFAYPGQDNLISNFGLEINKGQKVFILGSNGVGKSSVLRSIWQTSFLPQNQVTLPLRKVYFTQDIPEKLNINPQKPYTSIYEVQHGMELDNACNLPVPQNWEETVMDWLCEVVLLLPPDFKSRLDMNLFEMRLSPDFMAQSFEKLSPGTRKKLLLCILFASDPQVIIADELTNHLDREAIEVVKEWCQKSQAAMLLVDHSQEFLQSVGNNFVIIPNNKERKAINLPEMTFAEVVEYLENREENQRVQQLQVKRKEEQLQKNIDLLRRRAEVFNADVKGAMSAVKRRMRDEVENNPVLDEMDVNKRVVFSVQENKGKVKKDLLIRVFDLSYIIGQNEIQTIEEFKLYKGQRVIIGGGNGRGKSSFLKMLTQRVQNQDLGEQYLSGSIEVSKNLSYDNIFILNQITGYGQGGNLYRYIQDSMKVMTWEVVGLLKQLQLSKFDETSSIGHLSIGEFIRLQLGILTHRLNSLELLILDEPGNFLDIFTQRALVRLLQKYHGAMLLVTHDQLLASKIETDEKFLLN
jgi:ATP-binding cassette, subfamily F, member 3